ncbi:hypothetical protein C8R46DRAFT_1035861 [Mycena filopes]|nr:hypothetical protein C8R46DRAFT_1035861 [Mycena filopes]
MRSAMGLRRVSEMDLEHGPNWPAVIVSFQAMGLCDLPSGNSVKANKKELRWLTSLQTFFNLSIRHSAAGSGQKRKEGSGWEAYLNGGEFVFAPLAVMHQFMLQIVAARVRSARLSGGFLVLVVWQVQDLTLNSDHGAPSRKRCEGRGSSGRCASGSTRRRPDTFCSLAGPRTWLTGTPFDYLGRQRWTRWFRNTISTRHSRSWDSFTTSMNKKVHAVDARGYIWERSLGLERKSYTRGNKWKMLPKYTSELESGESASPKVKLEYLFSQGFD